MNISWDRLIDALNSSTKIASAFFVTSAVLCIGYKYEASVIPKIPDSTYIYAFSVAIFSGTILFSTLTAKVYGWARSFCDSLYAKYKARKARKHRSILTEAELTILMSFVSAGNDIFNVMEITYRTDKFTKLELSAAVDDLERKGLLDVQFDRDFTRITNTGREIALGHLEKLRKGA